jgi:hypothetical protein
MIDPVSGRFYASWQDENLPRPLDEFECDGAQAAIDWGCARAEFVVISLGGRHNTFFSMGDSHPNGEDDDDEPMQLWPPSGPPPGGW